MSLVTLTVRGEHVIHQAPERATVHARVVLEGRTGEEVYAGAGRSSAQLTDSITPLHRPDAGPVTWWSSDEVRTWARRPWHAEGVQLPLVHHADLGFRVKFRDFEALGRWLGSAVQVTGFTLDRVEWTLTERRREELVGLVRAEAVHAAQRKAQTYADTLQLGPVRAVEIADAGMLGHGPGSSPAADGVALRAMVGSTGEADPSFAPQDVEVAAAVDARFAAG